MADRTILSQEEIDALLKEFKEHLEDDNQTSEVPSGDSAEKREKEPD